MRCSFGARRDHAANLGELFHEIRLRVQPAGGVDDDDVAAVPARAVDRVVRDRRGIAAPLALYELRAGALRPDTELLLRRGTEGVGRGDDDGVAVLAQAVREFPDRRGLAGAVDADDEDDARLAGEVDARRVAEELGHLLRQRLVEAREVAARLEPSNELGRRGHTDVTGDQRLLQALPRCRVAGIEGRGGEFLREGAPAAPERVTQAREEARALLAALHVRATVAEQLSPGPRHGAEQ